MPQKAVTVEQDPPVRKPRKPPEVPQEIKDRWVGRTGLIGLGALKVPVQIAQVRNRYGNLDLLVSPIGGLGKQWVKSTRVKVSKN